MSKEKFFNGLKYITDECVLENTKIIFDEKEPNTLVKFYSNNEYSQDAVMNSYLYLSHYTQFNDAFEANESLIDLSMLDKTTYEDLFHNQELDIPCSYEEDKRCNFFWARFMYMTIFDFMGSVSLTTSDNTLNTLMWSHYATDKGFLIEFNKTSLLGSINDDYSMIFFPIRYVDELKQFNPLDAKYGGAHGLYLSLIGMKSMDWAYEREWRITCSRKSKNLFIPETFLKPKIDGHERKLFYKDCVNKIILGSDFFNNADKSGSIPPLSYKLSDKDTEFVTYLYENYNDRLFLCDILPYEKSVKRALIKIELKKTKGDNVFDLIYHF